MTYRLAYTMPDGSVSIVIAAPKEDIALTLGQPLTDKEYRKRIYDRAIPPEASDVVELAEDWQPPDSDRLFRNAWRQSGGNFTVDMPKAREMVRRALSASQRPVDDAKLEAAKTPDELRPLIFEAMIA